MLTVEVASLRGESQTIDEGVHLTAGFSYWKTHDFRMNPEHPPLVKLVASVPLLFTQIQFPVDRAAWNAPNEWLYAKAMLYRNTLPPETILLLGRLAVLPFGLSLGLLIALWSKRLWGAVGGILSLIIFAFDPNMVANARYVTTDVGVTFFFVLTIYFFERLLQHLTRRNYLWFALSFAFANVTKFSAVLLWPIVFALWGIKYWSANHQERSTLRLGNAARGAAGLLVATFLVAWAIYGFQVQRPLDDRELSALYESTAWSQQNLETKTPLVQAFFHVTDPVTKSGKALKQFFSTVPIPAYSFFRGLSDVTQHDFGGHAAYLLGMNSRSGWWYYFPVAFLVKTPLATLLLVFLSLMLMIRLFIGRIFAYWHREKRVAPSCASAIHSIDFHYIALIVSPGLYFLFSMTSNINLGVRHLLPMYPFLFILAGNLATVRFQRHQWAWYASISGMLATLVFTSLMAFPHYLSYFSDLVGGSRNGIRYLIDSNLDWGQELKRLGTYVDSHHIPFVYIAYFGQTPLETYLKDFRYLPQTNENGKIAQLDGWAAISASALMLDDPDYSWLRKLSPAATIGDAIYIYDLRKNTR